MARRLDRSAILLSLGLLWLLLPYAVSETWRFTGVSTAFLPFYLWQLAPFALLAALALRTGRISSPALALAALLVCAGTAAMQARLADSFDTGAVTAAVAFPLLGLFASVAVWGFDGHVRTRLADWPAGGGDRRAVRPATSSLLLGLLGLIAVAVLGARLAGAAEVPEIETFVLLFASIVVEALPFVLLGALVSALIEVFVPDKAFARISGLPLRLQVPGAALAGLALPVCECGSVPVARRLILRGMAPSAGLAFMLASPVLNPIVLLSTAVAYQGRGALEMVLGRAGLGLVLALAAGLVIGRRGGAAGLLRQRDVEEHHGHDHAGHDHGGHDHAGEGVPRGRRARAVLEHLSGDFFFMGKFVVAGGALAAILQTAVPQSVFTGVLASPFVGAILLMVLAFLLSLCSEADAFVAVSFIQFPLGPQLAFLVFGPVLDVKLALLYAATFGRGFVVRLLFVSVPIVLAGSLLFGAVVG